MKYEVKHTRLIATPFVEPGKPGKPDVVFKEGDVVEPKDLTDAGFDLDHLLKNGAVEPLKGTEKPGEAPVAPKAASPAPQPVATPPAAPQPAKK